MNANYTLKSTKPRHTSQHETIQVDLKATPYRLDDSPSRTGYLLLVFGMLWSAIPLLILYLQYDSLKVSFEGGTILGLFLFIGAAVLSTGLYLLTSKRVLTFHKNMVEIETKNFLKGANSQTLPYLAFKGVLMGEYALHRKHQPDLIFQTIELVHEDKALTVKLYEKLGKTPPRALWKEYVEQMHVPALQKDGDNIQAIDHDLLDLSLQERAKHSFTKPDNFSAHNIPDGLEINHQKGQQGNRIHIRITTNRITHPTLALFTAAPATFILLPFAFQHIPMIFPIAGELFLLIIGYMAYQDHTNKRELFITRSEISISDIQPQNSHKNTVTKLPLNSIENILIKGETFNKHVVIIGKEGEISTGTGMSYETLTWLQNYLRAAVVTA